MTDGVTRELSIINVKGLHARASAKFVDVVERFDAQATVEKDGMAVEAPTFLRIGVGPTHHLADQAETEIRSQVYMKAFGSLDARGQMVSRSDARLEGVAMWMAVWE